MFNDGLRSNDSLGSRNGELLVDLDELFDKLDAAPTDPSVRNVITRITDQVTFVHGSAPLPWILSGHPPVIVWNSPTYHELRVLADYETTDAVFGTPWGLQDMLPGLIDGIQHVDSTEAHFGRDSKAKAKEIISVLAAKLATVAKQHDKMVAERKVLRISEHVGFVRADVGAPEVWLEQYPVIVRSTSSGDCIVTTRWRNFKFERYFTGNEMLGGFIAASDEYSGFFRHYSTYASLDLSVKRMWKKEARRFARFLAANVTK